MDITVLIIWVKVCDVSSISLPGLPWRKDHKTVIVSYRNLLATFVMSNGACNVERNLFLH